MFTRLQPGPDPALPRATLGPVLSLRELERAARARGGALRRGAPRARRAARGPRARAGVLGARGRAARCLLSCRPRTARVALRAAPAAAPPSPPPFAQYLRAHLGGARLAAARLRGGDRVLSLLFDAREGRFELLLQLLGPRSNVYLLDGQARLVLSLRPLEETRRDLAGGAPWQPPKSAAAARGRRPLRRAGRTTRSSPRSRRTTRRRRPGPRARACGGALARGPREAAQRPREEGEARCAPTSPRASGAASFGRLRRAAEGRARAACRRARSRVEARDFATGETVEIPLDPALSPAANLEALFKRQKKAERQALRARQELGALEARRATSWRGSRPSSPRSARPSSPRFAERPEIARLLDRYAPAAPPAARARPERPKRGDVPARLAAAPLPEQRRPRDLGRQERRRQRPPDHAPRARQGPLLPRRGLAGQPRGASHRGARGPAARVAPRGGRARRALLEPKHAGRADVHVAAIKDVSKPKGAKPGLVHVHRGRTLHLRRDPARLERVLGGAHRGVARSQARAASGRCRGRHEPRDEPPRPEEPRSSRCTRDRDRDPGGGARRAPVQSVALELGLEVFEWTVTQGLVRWPERTPNAHAAATPPRCSAHLRGLTVEARLPAEGPDAPPRGPGRRALLRRRRAPVRAHALDDDRDRRRARASRRRSSTSSCTSTSRFPTRRSCARWSSRCCASLGERKPVEMELDDAEMEELLRALAGLTLNQARQAVARAVIEDGALRPATSR